MSDYDLRHHGDAEVRSGMLDFAVNVRSAAPPTWLHDVLTQALARVGRYPDPAAATRAVAARHGRDAAEVLLCGGAAEAFTLVARALRPRRPVCVHPSFTEPEAALRRAGHAVERVILPPPFSLAAARVPQDADLVVLGNPTNPTGVLHPADVVLSLCRPGRIVVVDEAFMDALPGEQHSVSGVRGVDGLVVVRSLTKTWSLAGLRAGYLLAPPDMVRALSRAQPHWPVSSLALAAIEVCSCADAARQAQQMAAEIGAQRTYLLEALAKRDITAAATSAAPFVLVQLPDADRVWRELREAGIAVRRGDTFPGLSPEFLRIAVREPELTDRLTAALDRILRR